MKIIIRFSANYSRNIIFDNACFFHGNFFDGTAKQGSMFKADVGNDR